MPGTMTSESRLTPVTRVRVAPSVYVRPFGEELVLLDFGRGEYFGLDAVGVAVWRALEEGRPLGAVAGILVGTFDVEEARALQDVYALVEELLGEGLVLFERP